MLLHTISQCTADNSDILTATVRSQPPCFQLFLTHGPTPALSCGCVITIVAEWGKHLIGECEALDAYGWNFRSYEPEDKRNLSILQLAGVMFD